MDNKNVLVKPVITEKATKLGEDLSKYSFIVKRNANKIQIKNAVETMYGVTVENVKTMVNPGKSRTRQTRTSISKGQTASFKKAIISLSKGETIDFYSNI